MVTVPCQPKGIAAWTQRTTLAGRDYLLSFTWLQRAGVWLLSIADQDGAPLVHGRVLTVGASLTAGTTDPRVPPGVLTVLDTQGGAQDPSFAELGTRYLVVYLDPAEVAA